jgi:hypothetical protein
MYPAEWIRSFGSTKSAQREVPRNTCRSEFLRRKQRSCYCRSYNVIDVMPASRIVHHADGVAYLASAHLAADHAIITSLPDHSEVPELGVDGWRRWFIETVALACRAVADDGVAIFYQTDVKHDGRWIDKGYLVHSGIDAAGSALLWHKIVCREPPGTATYGRPGYTHMLCASRARTLTIGSSTADVLPALGHMSWSKATGAAACDAAIDFVASIGVRVVVDPFCGYGSILAAANARGLDAIGVELSRRRASKARKLVHL